MYQLTSWPQQGDQNNEATKPARGAGLVGVSCNLYHFPNSPKREGSGIDVPVRIRNKRLAAAKMLRVDPPGSHWTVVPALIKQLAARLLGGLGSSYC